MIGSFRHRISIHHVVFVGTFLAVATVGSFGPARLWTDASGKHKTEAEFIDFKNGVLKLRKPDGKLVDVPLAKLSKDDAAFVKDQMKPAVGTAKELERECWRRRVATESLALYQTFLEHPFVDQAEKDLAKEKMAEWHERAQKNLVRSGRSWITRDAAQKTRKEVDRLITEASRLIEVDNGDLARQRLEVASKTDPEGIKADFLLGLIHAVVAKHAQPAEKHFTECVRRRSICSLETLTKLERANYVASLNNLALAEIRLRKPEAALNHWRQAVRIATPCPELMQNLGRIAQLSQTSSSLKLSPVAAKQFAKLYSTFAISVEAGTFQSNAGWLYMYYFPEDAPPPQIKPQPPVPAPAPGTVNVSLTADTIPGSPFAEGTGFVIHPGYVVTNRHVVDCGQHIAVIDPERPNVSYLGRVVALGEDHDVAIVQCPKLLAPALPAASRPTRLGAEIVVLGYPETTLLGSGLKATRGTISGLPDETNSGMFQLDAVVNHGNSGGPVCNNVGGVVSILTAGVQTKGGMIGHSTPMLHAVELLKKVLPDAKPAFIGDADPVNWEDIIETAGKSTVHLIVHVEQPTVAAFSKRTKGEKWRALEDPWCMTCNGQRQIDCRCARGTVRGSRTDIVGRNTATGEAILLNTPTRDTCPVCHGRGVVDCPDCSNGVDRSISMSRRR